MAEDTRNIGAEILLGGADENISTKLEVAPQDQKRIGRVFESSKIETVSGQIASQNNLKKNKETEKVVDLKSNKVAKRKRKLRKKSAVEENKEGTIQAQPTEIFGTEVEVTTTWVAKIDEVWKFGEKSGSSLAPIGPPTPRSERSDDPSSTSSSSLPKSCSSPFDSGFDLNDIFENAERL